MSLLSEKMKEHFPSCSPYCETCFRLVFITDVIQFVVAFIINTTLYTLIVFKLSTSKKISSQTNSPNRATYVRNSVARMLIMLLSMEPFSSSAFFHSHLQIHYLLVTVSTGLHGRNGLLHCTWWQEFFALPIQS